jgi:hypothetical protein
MIRFFVLSGFPLSELRSRADTLTWVVLAVLLFLVVLNALLYYKLWALEERAQDSSHSFNVMDLQVLRLVTTFICRYNECIVIVCFRHLWGIMFLPYTCGLPPSFLNFIVTFGTAELLLNIAIKWVAIYHHIWEVLGSFIGSGTV